MRISKNLSIYSSVPHFSRRIRSELGPRPDVRGQRGREQVRGRVRLQHPAERAQLARIPEGLRANKRKRSLI